MSHVAQRLTATQRELLLADSQLVARLGPDLGLWLEDDVRRHLSLKLGLPWMEAAGEFVDRQAFAKHRKECQKLGFLPCYHAEIVLHVMVSEPFDGTKIRALRNRFHCEIHPIGVSQISFDRVIARLDEELEGEGDTAEAPAPVYTTREEILSWRYREGDGIKFIERIVTEAYYRGASDIFLESYPDRLDIRYKCSGRCVVMPPIARRFQSSVLTDAKAFAGMLPRETRGYRDGRGEMRMPDGNVIGLRAVAQRSLDGETMTFRLLNRQKVSSLSQSLPFPPRQTAVMQEMINKGQGLILVCGPTGSGKTTTLWRCLLSLDSSAKKIVTIEDPVEYRFDRFVQLPVKGDESKAAGEELPETFSGAVRSCLRAAPDVILVGETRDPETAKAATEAALTGHLIFTTTHTPDSLGTIARFRDLGVSSLNIRQTFLAVVAQRLRPRLCECCRVEVPVTPAQRQHFEFYKMRVPERIFTFGACARCGGTGVGGVVPVFETLVIDPELGALIQDDFDEKNFRREWLAKGGEPLSRHALSLVADGVMDYAIANAMEREFLPSLA